MDIQTILNELKKEGWFFDEDFIKNNENMLQAIADKTLDLQLKQTNVSKRFAIATETTDNIVKGRKYELIESESMGYYIIDESGEETYYNHSCLNVC